jgi:hypothetical protein
VFVRSDRTAGAVAGVRAVFSEEEELAVVAAGEEGEAVLSH